MDTNGKLNAESQARMDIAIDAYRKNEAPLIVTSGWDYRVDSTIAVADAMTRYATDKGVPLSAVITERNSRDTVGDAVFTKLNLAIGYGWSDILVVTSNYHADRTKMIFSFVYGPKYIIDVRGAICAESYHHRTSEQESVKAFISTFEGIIPGDDKGIWERLRVRHPFYNGLIYPEI